MKNTKNCDNCDVEYCDDVYYGFNEYCDYQPKRKTYDKKGVRNDRRELRSPVIKELDRMGADIIKRDNK